MKANKEVTLGIMSNIAHSSVGTYKWDIITSSKDQHQKFLKENPGVKITFQEFKETLQDINQAYVNYIVTTGNAIILPYGLGKMCINKFRRKRKVYTSKDGQSNFYSLAVNWGKSRKEGKIVYFLNEDTDGYTYNFKWFKGDATTCRINTPELWRMKMCERGCKHVLRDFLRDPEKIKTVNYRETGTTKSNLKALEHEKSLS